MKPFVRALYFTLALAMAIPTYAQEMYSKVLNQGQHFRHMADMDGDGTKDIICGFPGKIYRPSTGMHCKGYILSIHYMGKGEGRREASRFSVCGQAKMLEIGDFDSDGDLDMRIFAHSTVTFMNQGSGTFQRQ